MSIPWDAVRRPATSLLDAVGRTPIVRLNRVVPEGLELYAKVEWYGPTGSVKDRIYREMLGRAKERGDLKPGMTIIECTTGNAGIAVSAAAAIIGFPCVIVMPEGMSEERKQMIQAYGAELVLTPGGGTDIDLSLAKMREMVAAEPGRFFFPGEFDNPDNPAAQEASGAEIWDQLEGRVDAVVASQGTGGWISGVVRVLKGRDAGVKAYAVESSECPLISEQRWGRHGVPGIGDGIVPRNLDLSCMDGIVTVSTDESLEMALRMAREEGMLCGPSSGMNVVASIKVARKHPELRRIVTVVPDTGQRYLSGELFGERPDAESPDRAHPIDPESIARIEANRDRLEFIA